MRRLLRGGFVASISLVGCTFAGLTDYDVQGCDPALPLAQSPCNRLNGATTSCQRYQCDPVQRTCVIAPLDADGDGDPSIACGGTDCDDNNPLRSGRQVERCDGVDNDCDGVADNGLLSRSPAATQIADFSDRLKANPDFRVASSNGQDAYATYLAQSPGCVRGLLLGGADSDAGCTQVTDGSDGGVDGGPAIRQPELGPVGVARESSTGIAFIRGPDASCSTNRLAYWSRSLGEAVLADCSAALPAIASFPLQSQAVIAFYDAPVAGHDIPIDDCAALAPAPLRLRWVDAPTGQANASTSAATMLGSALSIRPPSLLAVTGSTAVLLASPIDTSAGLWSLTPDGRVIPLASAIPELADARSITMALGSDGTTTRLAIVAEKGCRPNQGVRMVIAQLDPLSASFVVAPGANPFTAVTVLADPAPAATAPSVTWMAGTHEWWVTWVDQRNRAILRRVGADGSTPEPTVELGDAQLVIPSASSGGAVGGGTAVAGSAFLLRPDGSAVDRVTLACKQ